MCAWDDTRNILTTFTRNCTEMNNTVGNVRLYYNTLFQVSSIQKYLLKKHKYNMCCHWSLHLPDLCHIILKCKKLSIITENKSFAFEMVKLSEVYLFICIQCLFLQPIKQKRWLQNMKISLLNFIIKIGSDTRQFFYLNASFSLG